MSIFDVLKRKKEADKSNDKSYIAEVRHIGGEYWHQYDFLLAAQSYGWDYMVDSSDYLAIADLGNVATVTTTDLGSKGDKELIGEFNAVNCHIKKMPTLANEAATLAIGGISKTIGSAVKVVWINQSHVLRIFAQFNDEDLMIRYAETIIRRSFHTATEMKKFEPVK